MMLPEKEKLKLQQMFCNYLKENQRDVLDVFDNNVSSSTDDAISDPAICQQLRLEDSSLEMSVCFLRLYLYALVICNYQEKTLPF